jgi:2-keto-3-deoxy-galactonokinase
MWWPWREVFRIYAKEKGVGWRVMEGDDVLLRGAAGEVDLAAAVLIPPSHSKYDRFRAEVASYSRYG